MLHPFTQPDSNPVPVFSNKHRGNVDTWINVCGAMFGVAPLNKSDVERNYSTNSWFIDPITVSNSKYFAMAASRKNWHIEESGRQIHVHRYAYGRASVQTDGVPIECDTGAITLLDYGRPFTSLHTSNDCQSFFVPYDAIGYEPSDAPHALVYQTYSTVGALIGREMDNLLSQLNRGATFIAPADIQRFLGCVEVAMCPETASPSATAHMRESLKRAIQYFIEEHLDSPDLNTTLILQNFGISRASLYRMFEADAGVRAYINHRRLMRAVTDLASAPKRRGLIHRVSERWGFSSDAAFSRMIRSKFGVAPGSLFQMPLQYGSERPPKSDIEAMMLDRASIRERAVA